MRHVRRFATLIAAAFIVAPLSDAVAQPQPAADSTGYRLLERLVVDLVKGAAPGGGQDIGPTIIVLAKELKAAQAAKQVDDLFAARYARLLSAVRQALLMDPEVLYWPMYRYTMADFIEERTGQPPDWKRLNFIVNDHGGAGVGLGVIADAVMSEVVSLHIHLDSASRRPELLRRYIERGMKPK